MNGIDDLQAGVAKPRRRGRPANTSTDDTVATVLVAARRQFAAHGYAGTSNRTVAERGRARPHRDLQPLRFQGPTVHRGVRRRPGPARRRTGTLGRPAPDEAPFPRALLDAIEALRAADPSYVEFLASMYVEVRRHPELRDGLPGRTTVPDRRHASGTRRRTGCRTKPTRAADDAMWFWITFALGLAQLSALADPSTFAVTVDDAPPTVRNGPERRQRRLHDSWRPYPVTQSTDSRRVPGRPRRAHPRDPRPRRCPSDARACRSIGSTSSRPSAAATGSRRPPTGSSSI